VADFIKWDYIKVLATKVQSGEISATVLVNKSIDSIDRIDKEYNSIISICRERALQRADEIDNRIKSGEEVGVLAGVPFIAKDNFLTFGSETTAASNILKGFKAPYQSTAIEKLEDAGAICVAKANLDAFAHGGSTENSDFFTTKNPHDKTKVPGGSSGGSAAAVVLGLAPFALGTDTGGSIRLPASFCGAVGFKPTYGLVSRSGVVAMASSTDVIGPITTSVEDAQLVMDVISGKDVLDSTTIEKEKSSFYDYSTEIKGKKIGVIKEYFTDGLDSEVKKVIENSIEKLKNAGAIIEEVTLPNLSLALAAYYVIVPAEVSSNLSRYDGQRYGYRDKNAKTLDESYENSRSIGFGSEAKRRIMIGTHVLSSGYYDAYYKKAQTVRTLIINEFKNTFEKYDFLIGPTAPNTAFKIGENTSDPLSMYLVDIMTVAANLAGIPAISIPCGRAGGMPVGLQLMSKQKNDRELLGVSNSIEELLK
jgi:aspartyl-tRNA(Asn)/glutamyl-tRNA(Gln) amidotransferase subunit A